MLLDLLQIIYYISTDRIEQIFRFKNYRHPEINFILLIQSERHVCNSS